MRLKQSQMMFLITMASGQMAVSCFIICLTIAFKLRELKQRFKALAVDVENDMAAIQETAESLVTRAADQSRPVAWLESRVRAGKLAPKSEDPEAPLIGQAPNAVSNKGAAGYMQLMPATF